VAQTQLNSIPKLTRAHKSAIIITAIPASSNKTANYFYRIGIRPSDVKDVLPEAAHAGLLNARGPIMEIRVGPGIETARIAWHDDAATRIENIFGIGVSEGQEIDIAGLVHDRVLNDGIQAASLQEIAKAIAARLYASLVDRVQGEMSGDMRADIKPQGWLSSVEIVINPSGTAFSKLQLPERIPPIDIWSFLDSSQRAIILKLATPERQSP